MPEDINVQTWHDPLTTDVKLIECQSVDTAFYFVYWSPIRCAQGGYATNLVSFVRFHSFCSHYVQDLLNARKAETLILLTSQKQPINFSASGSLTCSCLIHALTMARVINFVCVFVPSSSSLPLPLSPSSVASSSSLATWIYKEMQTSNFFVKHKSRSA